MCHLFRGRVKCCYNNIYKIDYINHNILYYIMVYTCEKCKEEFKQKLLYTKHKKHCLDIFTNNNTSIEETETNKQTLGQFYTTNYNYCLQNMIIPADITHIVEPFAGNGDLLKFINEERKKNYIITCYDIEPKQPYIVQQDTLLNPPDMINKFVLTNPPYLARNKSTNKILFDKYKTNDLYKCFIHILIHSQCSGGILIVPLNFLCSIRKSDIELREKFLKTYNIIMLNIFEEQVFDDTSYTTCTFQFTKTTSVDVQPIKCYIYPAKKQIDIVLDETNNYTIGGEIYKLKQSNSYKIDRATSLIKDSTKISNILIKCLDDNIHKKISATIVRDEEKIAYIDTTPNLSARSYAILVIEPFLTIDKQEELAQKFNQFLNEKREQYNSLFLTNYRESNTIARKRISFGLVYEICNYLLSASDNMQV